MLFGGVVIGIFGGYGSVGFIWLLNTIEGVLWGSDLNPLQVIAEVPWYYILLFPALGLIGTASIVRYFAPEAKGHGVPEVMEAAVIRGGVIRPRVVLVKSLASALNIGTGGSVGREGPMVQIGSSIGSFFGQITQVSSRRMKTFVGCGAASGIAATFNAPIAGALFAVEIIIGDFGLAHFSPIVVSSVMATVISHKYLGVSHTFDLPVYRLVSAWELIPYALLGIITGLVALLFVRALYDTEDFLEQIKIPFYAKAAIGGLLVGLMGLLFPQVLGNGYPSISLMLENEIVWQLGLVLIFWKLAATCLTLGAGGSGGVFAPSLFLGAMTGGVLGTWMHQLFPNITATPGAYALVGMAGVVGAATHAPLTAILIIFELTNEYQIMLPVMLTTIVATVFAMMLKKESIYTLKLIRRGVDIAGGRDINILRNLPVRSAMRRTMERVRETTTLRELMDLMADSQHSVFFTVDKSDQLLGYITLNDLRRLIQETDVLSHLVIAGDIAHPLGFTLRESDTLARAMELFAQEGIDELPVASDSDHLAISATLWRQDVIEAYNREIFRRNMASELATKLRTHEFSPQPVEIVTGFSILERDVPKSLVNKTIRGSHLRDRFGVQVILVHQRGDSGTEGVREIMPDANYRLKETDTVLVFGETLHVGRFGRL